MENIENSPAQIESEPYFIHRMLKMVDHKKEEIIVSTVDAVRLCTMARYDKSIIDKWKQNEFTNNIFRPYILENLIQRAVNNIQKPAVPED